MFQRYYNFVAAKKCGTLPLMEHHFSPTSPRKDPSGPMLVKRKLPSP